VDAQRFLERPDSFLPFKLDQQQARDALLAVQRDGLEGFLAWSAAWNGIQSGCTSILPWGISRLLDTWQASRRGRIRSIVGAYLPFWLFDGSVEIRRSFESRDFGPPPAQKKGFDNLLHPGVNQPRASLLEKLHPFDGQALVPYEPHLLADWPIRVHSLDLESLIAEIKQQAIAKAKRWTTDWQLIPGMGTTNPSSGSRISGSTPEYRVCDMTYRLALAPVWIAILTDRDRRLLALVNGQTGKVALEPLRRSTDR
jgi:hypothetical protein